MSERLEMEKNKNYPLNPVSKAVNNDKSKDISRCNKNGRGRGSFSTRQEYHQNKKVSPQKFYHKGFDRRFKTRSWNSFQSDRNSSQEVKNEVGSVQNPGSKKGGSNASHLLNFTFSTGRDLTSFHPKHDNGWRVGLRKHFNKEQFLQANFKFVVKHSGDYTVHQADPDVLVDWSLVEEVQLPCYEEPRCPICLDYPSATKLTRCGHFYCWPCILHYLALSDKPYRKCPICDEAVKKNDLKSVIFLPKRYYSTDDEVTMELMYKERGTVQAIPVHNKNLYAHSLPTLTEGGEDLPFHKLFIASAHQVLDVILKREDDELQKMLREDYDSPEVCFIHEALELLKCRKEENMTCLYNHEKVDKLDCTASVEDTVTTSTVNTSAQQVNYVDAFDNIKILDHEEQILHAQSENKETPLPSPAEGTFSQSGPANIDQMPEETDCNPIIEAASSYQIPKDVYYFYQATDGQPIYLHPLNVKMLTEEFGSLKACPEKITAKIVQIEGNTMDENLRKKFRYLNHLPLHCEYLLVELRFNNIVSKQTWEKFSHDIKKRKLQRQNKKKVELRWEKRVEMHENKKKGLFPSASVDLGSLQQFPSCNEATAIELDGPPPPMLSSSPVLSSDMNIASSPSAYPSSPQQTSFAQMVKITPAQPIVARHANVKPHAARQSDDDEEDGAHSVPNYQQSFSLDIPTFDSSSQGDLPEKTAGKKKKFKKKVLFSTSMMNRTK